MFSMMWSKTFPSIICKRSRQVKPCAAAVGSKNMSALLDTSACVCGSLGLPDSALWCPLLWSRPHVPEASRSSLWCYLKLTTLNRDCLFPSPPSTRADGPWVMHSGLQLLRRPSFFMQNSLCFSGTLQSTYYHSHESI